MGSKDFVLPLGKAHIEREGTDVTLVTFSKMVGYCLDAAEELAAQGISVEVLNLRTLRPLDRDAIINSVKKMNRIVAGEDVPMPYAIPLEKLALPQIDDITAAVKRTLA